MTITKLIRETEAHVKTLAATKAEQIAILSKAQSLVIGDEYHLAVLAFAKSRIIKQETTK